MSKGSPLRKAYQALISKGRLQSNKSQVALIDQLSLLQDRLTNSQPPWGVSEIQHSNGIYIYGAVGTGKSRVADLFTATLPDSVTRRRAHFFEFMTDMHMRLHRARSEPNYTGDPLIRIGREIQSESSVLCLDEFQVSDIADAMILKRLFGSFWDSGGIMVSTSNRHPTDLYKDGLNRPLFVPFIEELQRRCVVFRMEGEHDYRMDGRKQHHWQDIFFTNADKFDDSLSQSLNGAELQPLRIQVVMNRSLTVQAASERGPENGKIVVSTSFAQLCEASLGAADYHALCARAESIYITGLRKFKGDELDVVRRFIVLVDVAYESKTQIVCLSSNALLDTFSNIMDAKALKVMTSILDKPANEKSLSVRKEGGSSSSMMSTFIGDMEWSATGLKEASLATGGAGEKDVRFAIGRAISRLTEMGSSTFGTTD